MCPTIRKLTRVGLFNVFDTDKTANVTGESCEPVEVSGPGPRIGLSGANKRMLHLLKKAKVQLIKIDQQKQLKLSQVRIDFLVLIEKRKRNLMIVFLPHFSHRLHKHLFSRFLSASIVGCGRLTSVPEWKEEEES